MKRINKTEEYMLYYEQFLALQEQGRLKEGSIYHILDLPDGLDLVEGKWTVKKAEQDAEGNIIHETYVKRLDLDYKIVDTLPVDTSMGKMIYLDSQVEPVIYNTADMIQVEDNNVTMNVSSQEFWDSITNGSYVDGLGYYTEADEESSRRFYEIYLYVTDVDNLGEYESVNLKLKTNLWERELSFPFLAKENNVISYALVEEGSDSQGELTFLVDNNVLFTRLLLITDQIDLVEYFQLESIVSNTGDVLYINGGSEFNLSNLKISNGSEYASFIPTKASDLENDIHFATEDYVEQNGGKIDRILLNEVEQEIVDKAVNLTIDKTTLNLSNVDNTSDLDKPISTATQTALNTITEKIPNQASATNQLADKDFVNSSINSYAATFKGSYATKADLDAIEWQTADSTLETYVTNNDYAYIEADETKNNEAWRYIYVKDETTSAWQPQFKVNDTPFTAEQLAAINSGITADIVSNTESHLSSTENPHQVTKEQIGLGNVNNTADLDKPISNAVSTEFAKYLPLSGGKMAGSIETDSTTNGALITDGHYSLLDLESESLYIGAPKSSGYDLKLRGENTRPTYNDSQLALYDDVPNNYVAQATLSNDAKTLTLTNKDGSFIEFQGGGGGSGSSNVVLVTNPLGSEVIQDTETSQQINVMTRDTGQKITGSKYFTGTVGNIQTEAGVYLGLDVNSAQPNANIAITSANTAAYIDMGRPDVDYDFRIIKWNTADNKHAQFVYGGNAAGAITIPQASGVMALTSDLNSRLALDGSNTMTGNLNLRASGAEDTNIGPNGIRWNMTSLPQDQAPQYVCTIDGFANGGRQKWASIADLKTQLGVPTNYVTTNTSQTISGAKTFSGNVTISGTLYIS